MSTEKVAERKEPLNLMLAELSEVKILVSPVSLCNENFKNQSLIDVQLMQVLP